MSRGGGPMLYVYAIADAPPGAELGSGLEGAQLRAVGAGSPVAIVSGHERPPRSGVEELWRHEEVVERLMEAVTVLPLRFGTTVAGEAELVEVLRDRAAEFAELLEAVRGAVELSVRAELPEAEPAAAEGGAPPGPSGASYMRDRGRALALQERAHARVHEPLAALARRSRVLTPGPGEFKAAYLVPAERVEAFTGLVGRLAGEGAGRVACTGPWPPYSFVAGAAR